MNNTNNTKYKTPEDKMPKGQTPGRNPKYPENKPSTTGNNSGKGRTNNR